MKLKKLFGQMVRFGLVGVLNTLLDMGIYALLTRLIFFFENPEVANGISYACGVACSLVLNKTFTFKAKGKITIKQVAVFIAVNLCALLVSSGMIHLYTVWGLTPLPAKVLSLPFSMGVNFIGNKLFVFKD